MNCDAVDVAIFNATYRWFPYLTFNLSAPAPCRPSGQEHQQGGDHRSVASTFAMLHLFQWPAALPEQADPISEEHRWLLCRSSF